MTITDEGVRIDMPILSTTDRRNVNVKECYLLLKENFIYYKTVSTYESLDEDTQMWSDKKGNWRFCRRKGLLADVDMYFDNKEQLWCINLEFSGISSGPAWLFEDPREAVRVYNILEDYITT